MLCRALPVAVQLAGRRRSSGRNHDRKHRSGGEQDCHPDTQPRPYPESITSADHHTPPSACATSRGKAESDGRRAASYHRDGPPGKGQPASRPTERSRTVMTRAGPMHDGLRHPDPGDHLQERLAIAGAGTIACGLAVTAARHGEVVLWARSEASADRARAAVSKLCERLEAPRARRARIRGDRAGPLQGATFIVEAVVEDPDHKAAAAGRAGGPPRPGRDPRHHHLLALDRRAGRGQRPTRALRGPARLQSRAANGAGRAGVPRQAAARSATRARALCEALGKTAGRGPRHAGVRRQPAAVPLPVRCRRADGRDRASSPATWTAA